MVRGLPFADALVLAVLRRKSEVVLSAEGFGLRV